jgi:hypothetical protein
MKNFIKILFLSLTISSAFAARVEDVTVLDLNLKKGKDSFEVKLQIKNGEKDSYFTVDITRDDEKAFDKLDMVLKKMKKANAFKLNLNIPSFSASPSGSYYKSEGISFSGSTATESAAP